MHQLNQMGYFQSSVIQSRRVIRCFLMTPLTRAPSKQQPSRRLFHSASTLFAGATPSSGPVIDNFSGSDGEELISGSSAIQPKPEHVHSCMSEFPVLPIIRPAARVDSHKGIHVAEKADEPVAAAITPPSEAAVDQDMAEALKKCCPPSRQMEEVLEGAAAMTTYTEHTQMIDELVHTVTRPLNEQEVEECIRIIKTERETRQEPSQTQKAADAAARRTPANGQVQAGTQVDVEMESVHVHHSVKPQP